MVASGCATDPQVSFVNFKTEIVIMKACYAILRIKMLVTEVARAPFMALLMRKLARELNTHRSIYWRGCSTCKVMVWHGEEFGAFKKTLSLKLSRLECRCMAAHSTQRLHMGTQRSQCSDTDRSRKSWPSVFFPYKCKWFISVDSWDVFLQDAVVVHKGMFMSTLQALTGSVFSSYL